MNKKFKRRCDRIRHVIISNGGFEKTANQLHRSTRTLYGWCQHERGLHDIDTIMDLARITDFSWIWIADGMGEQKHIELNMKEEHKAVINAMEAMTPEESHHFYHFCMAYFEAKGGKIP